MSSAPDARRYFVVGAETALSHQLNDLARQTTPGVDTRAFRAAVNYLATGEPPPDARAVLCAFRELGQPFRDGRFFPFAADRMAEISGKSLASFTTVVTIAPLTDLRIGSSTDRLKEMFASQSWERLYDASWADLVERIMEVLNGQPLLVLTPRGAALQSSAVMRLMFGANWKTPRCLLTGALPPAGQGALEKLIEAGRMDAIPELYDRMAIRRSASDVGLEDVTFDLLQDRFAEDVARIAQMPGVDLV